jgi:tRNA A37 N6-isopentenylltransferase MiaA
MYDSQRSSLPRGPGPEVQKEDPKTAEELVEEQMPKITEALELNDFEQAVVSSILTKYVQQRIELQILELPEDKAREAYEKIADDQKAELEQGLPPDKFNGLMDIMENGYNSKKVKKDRKKKKKT